MLLNGATKRQRPLVFSATITETSSVAPAITGPADVGASAGRSSTVSNAIGSTLTAISIVTVPDTVGVTIRLNAGSHQARAICIKLQTIIRLANVASPAAVTVATMMAMNIAAGQASTTWPAPKRWNRDACNAVMPAQITMAENTLHVR